jgi:hypothetical protein
LKHIESNRHDPSRLVGSAPNKNIRHFLFKHQPKPI